MLALVGGLVYGPASSGADSQVLLFAAPHAQDRMLTLSRRSAEEWRPSVGASGRPMLRLRQRLKSSRAAAVWKSEGTPLTSGANVAGPPLPRNTEPVRRRPPAAKEDLRMHD
jgi:hypothetical protein